MKSDTIAIRILLCTAVTLLLALVFMPKPATAEATAIKDGDFVVCTFPLSGGDDALYVAETRQYGTIAVFAYDRKLKALVPQAVRRIDEAFIAR